MKQHVLKPAKSSTDESENFLRLEEEEDEDEDEEDTP